MVTAARIPIYQIPLPLFDATAAWLLSVLERMVYDDALTNYRGWRVEYLHINAGLPHFRLYYKRQPFGMVDVRPMQLPIVRLKLALFLSGLGFTPYNAVLIRGGSRTAYRATKGGYKFKFELSCEQQAVIERTKITMQHEAHRMHERRTCQGWQCQPARALRVGQAQPLQLPLLDVRG